MKLHFLKHHGSNDAPELTLIRQEIERLERECRRSLEGLSEDLCVTVEFVEKDAAERGVYGYCHWPDLIELTIAKNYEHDLAWIVQNQLAATFFHEAHHSVRRQTIGWGDTILEGAISEGLAVAYSRDYSGQSHAVGEYDEKVIDEWTQELLAADEPITAESHREWFSMSGDGRRQIAYKVGTHIVDRAIKNSGGTAISLVGESAANIMSLGAF